MRTHLINALTGLAMALPAAALAFQPLITDDTGTQGAGGNQIEAGYNQTRERSLGAETVTGEIPLVYTRGITDALDIYVGGTRMRIVPDAPGTTESGWSNPVIGAKWRFYDSEASKLSFALKPELSAGVSGSREARGLGTGSTSWGLGLLMTQETGFGQFLANLQIDRAAKDWMAYMELGAIYSPGKDLDFALGVIRNTRDGETRSTQVTTGLT